MGNIILFILPGYDLASFTCEINQASRNAFLCHEKQINVLNVTNVLYKVIWYSFASILYRQL